MYWKELSKYEILFRSIETRVLQKIYQQEIILIFEENLCNRINIDMSHFLILECIGRISISDKVAIGGSIKVFYALDVCSAHLILDVLRQFSLKSPSHQKCGSLIN